MYTDIYQYMLTCTNVYLYILVYYSMLVYTSVHTSTLYCILIYHSIYATFYGHEIVSEARNIHKMISLTHSDKQKAEK